ncbi:MAG: rRNA maturation RNase YbeY [Bacteroidetes bacterium]|jgi:rRNA maturation RNase YbeY|nr:rRNA maturation RNase YbeY [Bacteroidota bacterium]
MTTYPEFPSLSDEPEETLTVFNLSGIEVPLHTDDLQSLLRRVEQEEEVFFSEVELVFVDEEQIVDLNREHLGRDYVTDIITFGYKNSKKDDIEGTLYCCAQRIKEQSVELNIEPKMEFSRVFVHGLLHLTGYEDASEAEKEKMRDREDRILQIRANNL